MNVIRNLTKKYGNENVGFKVWNTKLDSDKVSFADVDTASWLAEQEGTVKLFSYWIRKWVYICKLRLLTTMV